MLEVALGAYTRFFTGNAPYSGLFPSLDRFEREVVAMTADLMHAERPFGNITSGGSESILLAVKSARDRARARRPRVTQPEMVVPESAHPAFWKAEHYFGLKIVPTPLQRDTWQVDLDAYRAAVNDNTVLLVGSAPSLILGLGGALTSRGNSDHEFFDLNIRTTFTLLMAARAAGRRMQRFVYASSDAVYLPGPGGGPSYLPIDEAHPRLAATVYGGSKVAAEDLCFSFWHGFGVPITVLQFGATADADELTNPRSVFARWLFLKEATAHLERNPSPEPDVVESIPILRGLDRGDSEEHPVIFADLQGKPEIRQSGDARDVAHGCARVVDVTGAVGESFNLGGVAPFSADELGHHLARRLGLTTVTARLPIARGAWYISSAKARGILGYDPQRTVFAMVDDTAGRALSQNRASLADNR